MYYTQPFEYDALAIAGPFIEYAQGGDISTPKMCRDGSMRLEEQYVDYVFLNHGSPKAWSWPARQINDDTWDQFVRAGPRPE